MHTTLLNTLVEVHYLSSLAHELNYHKENGVPVVSIIFLEPQEVARGINITLTARNLSVAKIKIFMSNMKSSSPTPEAGKLLF